MDSDAPHMKALTERFGAQALSPVDRRQRGYDLRLQVELEDLIPAAQIMKEQGFFLEFITAVDPGGELILLHVFTHYQQRARVQVRSLVSRHGSAPSLCPLYPAADWQEREVFDMFGLVFMGHPNLKRLLLPEDADFHPLLRDFVAQPRHGGETVNLEAK